MVNSDLPGPLRKTLQRLLLGEINDQHLRAIPTLRRDDTCLQLALGPPGA